MDLAHQISQQQSTEVLVEDDDGVMEAALRVLRQSDFNPYYTLSVKFSKDKQSNNIRNQRRFLRCLVSKLQMSEIFEGPDGSKNLALNSKGRTLFPFNLCLFRFPFLENLPFLAYIHVAPLTAAFKMNNGCV